VTYGAVLVAIMVLRPQGILGYREITFGGIFRTFKRWFSSGSDPDGAASDSKGMVN
jgi:hypothetical protein